MKPPALWKSLFSLSPMESLVDLFYWIFFLYKPTLNQKI